MVEKSETTLKSECEELERQCDTLQEKESDLEQRNATLHEECARTMQELAEVTSERDSLVSEKFSLELQVEKTEHSTQELQGMLDNASSELAVYARQLQKLHGDLRIATRRADEAEKIQKDLQLEGTNLMRSLDEMRPKIVELTSEKLNLTEEVERLQHALRDREGTISELTSSLDDARSEIEKMDDQWQQKWKEQAQKVVASSEMQAAHTALQDQLDDALQSLRNLESQRASQRQELVRKSSEVEKLNSTITGQSEELSALKKESEDQRVSEVYTLVFPTRVSMTIFYCRTSCAMSSIKPGKRLKHCDMNYAPKKKNLNYSRMKRRLKVLVRSTMNLLQHSDSNMRWNSPQRNPN